MHTAIALLSTVFLAADVGIGDELVRNGGFERLDEGGRPVGWRWLAGAHVRKDDGNTWVEIDQYGAVGQDIAIDPSWMKLKVRFRMRVTGVQRGDDGWKNARLAMQWVDAAGKHVDPWPDVIWAEGSTDWVRHERVFLVPQGATTLQFTPAMFGLPGGKAEYDDLSVTLVRKRATTKEDLPAPAGYEDAWALAGAWRAKSATRETICLNGLWQFLPVPDGNAGAPPQGPQGWGWFKVPGIWPRSPENGPQDLLLSPYMEDRTDLGRLDQAWYLRKVVVPAGWRGRRVAIDPGLVQTHARVFVDGAEAGAVFFPGGEVDLTKLIRPGTEQTLAVLVTARPLEKEQTVFMAPDRVVTSKASIGLRGLAGDVMLVSRPAGESLDDVRITTSTRDSMIRVDAKIDGYGGARRGLRAQVLEGGKVVKEFASGPLGPGGLQGGLATVAARWAEAKLWDLHTPRNLYDLVLRLEDDAGRVLDETLPIRFGFREFRIDGRDFYLNDKRIHLRALFSRNINGEADLGCIEACRRTCRRIKEYGFNHLITANYHFQPGTVGYMDGLFRAADEEGVLCSFSLPHFRDFNSKLDTPAQAERYRTLCEWLIRRARHHPSVVMYAMSHNATGYHGDQNPLRIDGLYDPEDPAVGGAPNRNRGQARIAAGIAKALDPTRPVYHHEAGNLGDVYTLNIYLNWAPMQERSDWLEHWATRGVKPLFFVEWGLPHISSWSSYRGPNFIWRSEEYQSIWDAEFNAASLGGAAYELTDARIRSREYEEQLWATGKPFPWSSLIQHFRSDQDHHVRMKAMFADDNWRCLRAWGISAMLPWDQEQLWKQAKGAVGGARPVEHEPSRLKQPGIVADRLSASESWMYHPEAEQIAPTALGESFLRWNQPLCAFIGGGPDANDFTDKAHNYVPGETVRKRLVVLNDTREDVDCHFTWKLEAANKAAIKPPFASLSAGGGGSVTVAPGGREMPAVEIELSDNANPDEYVLTARFDFGAGREQSDTFRFQVLPKPGPRKLKSKIALFDPKGMTAKLLDGLGVKYEKVDADAKPGKDALLVIGREAVGLTNRLPDLTAVRDGLRVLVFEQTADVLAHRLGFRVNVHGLRQVFRRWVEWDLQDEHLRGWRGAATLVPPYLPIEGVEKDNPRWSWCGFSNTQVWRCGNRGSVASVLIEKPPVGDFRPLLDGGFDLQYAPLLEYVEGKGRVLFCQLDVTGRTERSPEAEHVCRALLAALDEGKRPRFTWQRNVYHAGGREGEDLLRQLGVPFAPWRADTSDPSGLLVVTPGAKDLADVAGRAGHVPDVFLLGLSGKEMDPFWPGAAGGKPVRSYGTPDVPVCDPPDLEFLSPAERSWRTRMSFLDLDLPGDFQGHLLKRDEKGNVLRSVHVCQIAPWMFDCKARPYLRTSYRRNVFLVSRLLHNLGATARTPLLERLSRPGGRNELVLPGQWVGQVDRKDEGRKGEWFRPAFDAAGWKPIRVPGMFDEEFPGLTPAYNGLFWYRLRFKVPADLAAENLTLDLGAIDDESWVWLNGEFLGEVTKQTHPKDYWAAPRKHAIKPGLLRLDGENVLVVLVNDTYQSGGIRGTPAIRAPGAWLSSYYVQEPIAADDPYRYYRW